VKPFKKPKSKFYWYITLRGCRYRRSTQKTKSARALQVASLKLASVMENTDPLPSEPPVLGELAERCLIGSTSQQQQAGRENQEVLPKRVGC
jgi:hypothetical protein